MQGNTDDFLGENVFCRFGIICLAGHGLQRSSGAEHSSHCPWQPMAVWGLDLVERKQSNRDENIYARKIRAVNGLKKKSALLVRIRKQQLAAMGASVR